MSAPPDSQSDYEFSFPAGNATQPPRQKPQVEENDNILAEVAEDAAGSLLDSILFDGCLWGLITFPFRILIRLIRIVLD